MNAPEATKRGWQLDIALGALIVLLTVAVYWPARNGDFIWDDHAWLWNGRTTVDDDGWHRAWYTDDNTDYWPLTATAFWVQYRLWDTEDTRYEPDAGFGYHAVNMLLHALGAILIWRVLLRLAVPGAWLIAALFAAHPVCVLSVAWIVELKNTLSLVLFALTLLLYLRFDDTAKRRWYFAALAAFFFTLAAKTSPIMLPVLLLGIAWWKRNAITAKDVLRSLPFFALSGAFAVTTILFQHGKAIGRLTGFPENIGQRIYIVGRSFWTYIATDLAPISLPIIYPRWDISSPGVWAYLWPVAILAVLGVLIFYRRTWGRGPLGAFGYMLIVLLPVLGFVDMSFMHIAFVSDHLQYLAVPAVIALVVAGGWTLAIRFGLAGKLIGGAAAVVVLVGLSTVSFNRAAAFTDEEALWKYAIKNNPNAWLAYNNLGRWYQKKHRYGEALTYYNDLIERIRPDYAQAYNNRGLLWEVAGDNLRAMGNLKSMNDRYDQAIADYDKAIELDPQYAVAYGNRAVIHSRRRRFDLALADYDKALALNPQLAEVWSGRGATHMDMGQLDKAIADFDQAIKLMRNFADAHHNRAGAWMQKGQLDKAVADYAQALEYDPKHFQAHYGMGMCLARRKDYAGAIAHFDESLAINPRFVLAYQQRGLAYMAIGQKQLAINDFEAALKINPQYAPAAEELKRMRGTQ